MKISLPDQNGYLSDYHLCGTPVVPAAPLTAAPRVIYAAAHVVANPFVTDPAGRAMPDWDRTMAFRRHLAGLGLGIAEAMDTAQRGMGLDWPCALALIGRTRAELPDALLACGCGTDHLPAGDYTIDQVKAAYLHQVDAVQSLGGRIILMAGRALVRAAKGPDDYIKVYSDVLENCDHPVILHWLGDMFDPALKGYWGTDRFDRALETVIALIAANRAKVDGIKISLLDKDKEIQMRRLLPDGVKMYTGDDFNYPELIAGDAKGHSHALLGIFDPLAPVAACAMQKLGQGDVAGFHALLDPTLPLARHVFGAPTHHYKTGVVFLAWLNGFQDHFIMLGGAQAMRPLAYFTHAFRLADGCGLLRDPDMAVQRMKKLLALYGV